MSSPLDVTLYRGHMIELYYDEDSSYNDSPRDWDNIATFMCEHTRYTLGDTTPDNYRYGLGVQLGRFRGWAGIARYLSLIEGAVVVPLGLYDHSGLSMYAGGGPHAFDQAGWDSGTVGLAFVTSETMYSHYLTREDAHKAILSEIKVYDQFLRGDVYYLMVYDLQGADMEDFCTHCADPVETLGGIYGWSEAIADAKEYIDFRVSQADAA